MKIWTPIFNFIAIFILILLIPGYYNFAKSLDKEFDQARLDIAVDNATKAMMIAATDVDSIDLDYIDPDSIILTPGKSIDFFTTVMCFCYDMEPTHHNKNIIEASICSMVLADEFGYYIAELVEDDLTPEIPDTDLIAKGYTLKNGLYEKLYDTVKDTIAINKTTGKDFTLRWSMRIPYSRTNGNTTETFSFGYNPILRINNATGSTSLLKDQVAEDDEEQRKKIIAEVNTQVSNAIEAEIVRRNANSNNSFDFKFYLPHETTTLGVNPIKGPSALVFLNNATYASNYSIDAVNVGGYRAQQRQYIVCFTMGGQKFYCYAKQLPDTDRHFIDTYVSTMREACDMGYIPYIPYLMNDKYNKAQ